MNYESIPDLKEIVLENSYVLGVTAEPRSVRMYLDAVLTPRHNAYETPSKNEQECYRRGVLQFSDVTNLRWDMSTVSRATDATGEFDYGSVDHFSIDEHVYRLEGDFGNIDLSAGNVDFDLEK